MAELGAIPAAKENNVWYACQDSDTAIIFVHGIFSDSRGCWLRRDLVKIGKLRLFHLRKSVETLTYWPELISKDDTFAGADIFLAGYSTQLTSGEYKVADCANQLYTALSLKRKPSSRTVWNRQNLVFVTHSTGGIVVRYVLTENQVELREKNIGIVLIASPSAGSYYASRFSLLSEIYKNELGASLQEHSTILEDIDSRFGRMVSRKPQHIPNLMGAEACENQMVYRDTIFEKLEKYIPPLASHLIVDRNSAGRYFLPAEMIPNTDHFSIVKPSSPNHDSHLFLLSFWQRYVRELRDPKPGDPGIARSGGDALTPVILRPSRSEPSVGRGPLIHEIRTRLLSGARCALFGAKGSGKKALALEMAYDDELGAKFQDGVLWGHLGPGKDASAVLVEWAEKLGLPRNSIAGATNLAARAVAVEGAIGERRILLIVVDCTDGADAQVFAVMGVNCAHLLTSVLPDTAQIFSPNPIEVNGLSDDDAVKLFETTAPDLALPRQEVVSFVQSVEGRPEEITRVARSLWPFRAQKAKVLDLLRGFKTAALEEIVTSSLQHLQADLLVALRAICLLPPSPNTFSEACAVAIAGTGTSHVSGLIEAGLIETPHEGRLSIPEIVPGLARAGSDEAASRRLVEFFANYSETHLTELSALSPEYYNILAALSAARALAAHREFVRMTLNISRFLEVRGEYSKWKELLIEAHGMPGEQRTRAEVNLQLARLHEKLGENQAAVQYAQAGLADAGDDPDLSSSLLAVLGHVELNRGLMQEAKAHLEKGLSLAGQTGNIVTQCDILISLGVVNTRLGNYDEANQNTKAGLKVADASGNLAAAASLYTNLGVLRYQQKRFQEAIEEDQRGLAIAEKIGFSEKQAALMQALAGALRGNGEPEKAEEYLTKALDMARRIQHRWYVATILNELGLVLLDRGKPEEAVKRFEDAMEQSPPDTPDIKGYAQWGLAKASAAAGRIDDARSSAKLSVDTFKSIHHHGAAEVAEWLLTLE